MKLTYPQLSQDFFSKFFFQNLPYMKIWAVESFLETFFQKRPISQKIDLDHF
jgi:hypothetical protein